MLMTATQDETALHVPARVVPVPTTVSAEAQAFLASGPLPSPDYPALDDAEGWRAMIAFTDEMVLKMFDESGLSSPEGFEIDEIDAGGVRTYVIAPTDLDPDDRRVYFEPHGGAFIVGGGEVCRATGTMTRGSSASTCGQSTIGCRPITRTPRRWTTAWRPTARSSTIIARTRSSWAVSRPVGPRRGADPPGQGRRVADAGRQRSCSRRVRISRSPVTRSTPTWGWTP